MTIFKTLTGSHLYGLNTDTSDIDYLSVYLPDKKDIFGLNTKDFINLSTNKNTKNTVNDIDEMSYSLKKYLKLLLKNNPNIIETLYSRGKNLITLDPIFEYLYINKNKIVSKKVYTTFLGYAKSQKDKLLNKSLRFNNLTKAIKDIEIKYNKLLNTKYKLTEEDSIYFNTILKYYKGTKNNTNSFHKGMYLDEIYSLVLREVNLYGWRVKTPEFTMYGLDLKFAYHLVRMVGEAKMLLEYGKIVYPIKGDLKTQIVDIREGKLNLNEILELTDYYENEINKLYKTSWLINEPDYEWFNDWLIDVMMNYVKEMI